MQSISDFILTSSPGRGNVTLSTSVYSLEAVHAAAYPFCSRYHVLITPTSNDTVTAIFEAKAAAKDIGEDLKEFVTSLVDHQVRVQLDKSNGKIRDLIVAHAFSPLDLDKETRAL